MKIKKMQLPISGKNNLKNSLALAFTLFTLTSTTLYAQPMGGARKDYHLSIGGGYILKTNIRKNNQYEDAQKSTIAKAIPMAQIFIGPVQIGQGGLTINVVGQPFLGGYLNVSQLGDNYYGIGMAQRKESWSFGVGAKIFGLTLQLNKDINGRSHGHKGQVNFGKLFMIHEDLPLRVGVGAEILDQNFMDYYYGVTTNEVTTERKHYAPTAAINYSLSIFPVFKVTEKINLTSGYSLKFLDSKIKNSPTTRGNSVEHALIFGATYLIK